MNFDNFLSALEELERSISVTSPVAATVKRAYWGAPPQSMTDLPCAINALSEPERTLGFGSREQRLRIQVQVLVGPATGDTSRQSRLATALWFAAKDVFDRDPTIGGTVSFSTLRGGEPTVPVLLQHAGQAYIGLNAYLEIQDAEAFEFGGE